MWSIMQLYKQLDLCKNFNFKLQNVLDSYNIQIRLVKGPSFEIASYLFLGKI